MSTVFTDATIILDAVDLSGDTNELSVEFTRADLNRTTFRNGGARQRQTGLPDMAGTAAGLWTADVDDHVGQLSDVKGQIVIAPSAAVGSPCFNAEAHVLSFSRGGKVDDLVPWAFSFGNARRAGVARGTILFDPTQLVTAPVAASGLQLGALGVDESATVRIQVLSIAGAGTIDVDIESSPSNGWSSPTVEASADALSEGDVVTFTVEHVDPTNTWWRAHVSDADDDAVLIVTVDQF